MLYSPSVPDSFLSLPIVVALFFCVCTRHADCCLDFLFSLFFFFSNSQPHRSTDFYSGVCRAGRCRGISPCQYVTYIEMATAIATFLHSIDGGGVGQGIHQPVSNSHHSLAYIHHVLVSSSNSSSSSSSLLSTVTTIHPNLNIIPGNEISVAHFYRLLYFTQYKQ